MEENVSGSQEMPGKMFPSLAALDQALRDLSEYVQQQQQQQQPEDEVSSMPLATISLTSASALFVSRLLTAIEEAFTPDPLHDAALLFEHVIVPLLRFVPWKHNTHLPLDETLQKLRLSDSDAFRCWVVQSLNTADSLYEATALVLGKAVANDAEEVDDSFESERVQRLRNCLGVNSWLLDKRYVMRLLSFLQELQHPGTHVLSIGEKERRVVYHLSTEDALPLFCGAPREVHVDLLQLHRVHGKKKRKKKPVLCSSESMREEGSRPRYSTKRGAAGAEIPPCCFPGHMVQQHTTEDSGGPHANEEKSGTGGYCCVSDATTQTLFSDVYMHNGKNDDGVATTSTGTGGSQLKDGANSVGVNTAHPSPLMTFVELLDAQEQLEGAQVVLRRREESLQLREKRLKELVKEYDEKLLILTHVLHDTEMMYNGLAANSSKVSPAQRTPAEVEARMLNLIEVIYGSENDSGTVTATTPIQDTPEARAAALQLIDYHEERQREGKLHRLYNDKSPVSDSIVGLRVFPPVKISRPVQLQLQSYRCSGCGVSLREADKSRFSFKKPRRCHYCTQLYCHECHVNLRSVLPFSVLTAWDFTPRHVCKRDYECLQCKWDHPWFTLGNLEENMEKQHFYPAVLRESVQIARVLRHWFLVSVRMVRCCTDPLPKEFSALLQTYYADTDVMYSLNDLQRLKYSEDHGVAARELSLGKEIGGWMWKNMSVRHSSDALRVGSSLVAAAVGGIITAIPYHTALRQLRSIWPLERNAPFSSSPYTPLSASASASTSSSGEAETSGEQGKDRSPPLPVSDGTGSFVTAEKDVNTQMSPPLPLLGAVAVVSGDSCDDESQKDLLHYLVFQIQAMEQHLLRDCHLCVARATTVCELCGRRDKAARLPLADAEVVGLDLLERARREREEKTEGEAQLLRLARVAKKLVRGNYEDDDGTSVVACRRCGARYHKACLEGAHCLHCP